MPSVNINFVIVAGCMVKDPELRKVSGGRVNTEFVIAVNNIHTRKKAPEYITILVWQKRAEAVVKHCKKGSNILVKGKIQNDFWVDKNTKEKKRKDKIVAQDVCFLSEASKIEAADFESLWNSVEGETY